MFYQFLELFYIVRLHLYSQSRGNTLYNLKDDSHIKYLARLYALDKIHYKQFYIKRDDKGRRIYTNLTGLKKELRQFLNYDGERLVELDIANSQPYFLNMLLSDNFFTELNTDFFPFFKVININSKKCMELAGVKSEDIDLYRRETSNGNFYSFLNKPFERALNKPLSEKEVKGIVFEIFFSRNNYNSKELKLCKVAFAEIFPTLNNLMFEIKKVKHNSFAILMQKIEAHIMLNIIATKIIDQHPNTPIFTIHDSIMCMEKDKMFIKQILIKEIESFTNIEVTIRDK
jgi:hypothetical protein